MASPLHSFYCLAIAGVQLSTVLPWTCASPSFAESCSADLHGVATFPIFGQEALTLSLATATHPLLEGIKEKVVRAWELLNPGDFFNVGGFHLEYAGAFGGAYTQKTPSARGVDHIVFSIRDPSQTSAISLRQDEVDNEEACDTLKIALGRNIASQSELLRKMKALSGNINLGKKGLNELTKMKQTLEGLRIKEKTYRDRIKERRGTSRESFASSNEPSTKTIGPDSIAALEEQINAVKQRVISFDWSKPLSDLSDLKRELDRLGKTKEKYRQVLQTQRQPMDVTEIATLANTLFEKKDYKQVIFLLTPLIATFSNDARLRRLLARAYYETHDLTSALPHLDMLCSLAPDDRQAHRMRRYARLAEANHLLAQGKPDDMRAFGNRLLALDREDGDGYAILARYEISQARYEEAKIFLNSARRLMNDPVLIASISVDIRELESRARHAPRSARDGDPLSTDELIDAWREVLDDFDLRSDFSTEALREAETAADPQFDTFDMRSKEWISVDKYKTHNIEQIAFAQAEGENIRLFVAVTNVASYIPWRSAIDKEAFRNTASIRVGNKTVSMIPDSLVMTKLSLFPGQDRHAVVTDMLIAKNGDTIESTVYLALVRNHAKLTFESVESILSHGQFIPRNTSDKQILKDIQKSGTLLTQLQLQFEASKRLHAARERQGKFAFTPREPHLSLTNDGQLITTKVDPPLASTMVNEQMLATNQATNQFLKQRQFPRFEYQIKRPRAWESIVAMMAKEQIDLPPNADSDAFRRALFFLKAHHPERLMPLLPTLARHLGHSGYWLLWPQETAPGNFDIFNESSAPSTAPGRSYIALTIQRLLVAACLNRSTPFDNQTLREIARWCTMRLERLSSAERSINKIIYAQSMVSHVGESYVGRVSGRVGLSFVVHLDQIPVDGILLSQDQDFHIGQRIRVKVLTANPSEGRLEFTLESTEPVQTRSVTRTLSQRAA